MNQRNLEKRVAALEEIVRLLNEQIKRLYTATEGNLKSVEALAELAGLKIPPQETGPAMPN